MSTPTPSAAPTGDGGTQPTGQVPAPAAPDAGTAPTATLAPQTPTDPAGPPAADSDPGTRITRLEAELAAARKEAGKSRTVAKENAANEARAELAQQIGKALGIVTDDTPPDPAKLTEQLTASQQQAKKTAVQLAVYRNAAAAGGDPDALLDSVAFVGSLADVDPTDTAAVQAAITAAVTANPKLGNAPAGPARGGTEFTPVASGVTAEQFAAMNYQQRADLYQSDPETYRRYAG